ncbi:MAG TPA: putative toxin-antitoxin system toxin component, PIN family [Rhodothermales bacterium]|nr:putative toxin-antitoxin system toxin component, PIN family [Rhodothermales bacterium]
MRVFLDTNVLVSAFATRGLSADVVHLILTEHDLLTGEVVLTELRRILRDKLGLSERRIDEIEALLRRCHVEPVPAERPDIDIRDEDDVWVLASAIIARADVLVTGDRDLLDVSDEIQTPRILNPRGFWTLLLQPP